MKKIRVFLKEKSWTGVFSLGLGSIIGQILNLFSQPLITRIVSPDELGIYSFLISMANLVIPIASLKLYMLIVIVDDDEEALALTRLSLFTIVLISIVYFIVISIMLEVTGSVFSTFGTISYIIPVLVITNAISQVFLNFNNRYKEYSLIAHSEVIKEFTKSVFQVLLGFFGTGALGQSIGYALAPLGSIKLLKSKYNDKKNNVLIDISTYLKYYKKYFKHILYLVPAQFINSFSYSLITLSVISMYSASETGYYSVSIRVLGLPLILISNNMSRVFLKRISEDFSEGNSVWETYVSVVKKLSLLSIIGFSILALIAPKVSGFVFGEGYVVAGEYITILCGMFAIRFVASSIMGSYIVFDKQKMDLFFQIILVLSGILAYLLGSIYHLNIYKYLFLISSFYGFIYLMIIVNIGYICYKKTGVI